MSNKWVEKRGENSGCGEIFLFKFQIDDKFDTRVCDNRKWKKGASDRTETTYEGKKALLLIVNLPSLYKG